ncbi:MAG: hypothetical protein ABID79_03160 [Elusimicrobiota bacterium]
MNIHRLSSVIHHPSPTAHRLSSTIYHSLFIIRCLLLVILYPSFVFADGLSTNFVNINLENLSINKEYNFRVSHNLPLKITNKSKKNIDIVIDVQIPKIDSLKPNINPIPSTNWVIVLSQKHSLSPAETSISDVVLKIPKNKKLCGKTFQFNIEICGYPSQKEGWVIVVPSLLSKVRFSIEKKKKKFLFWQKE